MFYPNRDINHEETSIGDMKTIGFVEADFDRFLSTEGLKKLHLQRIWYLGGFVQFVVSYINKNRSVELLIDLPLILQRGLVVFDNFLSQSPFLSRLCWHWTLVAQRPYE